MKWLVLPFDQPLSMRDTPRAIRGWWFGARTVRQNPRAGVLLAETITRAMAQLDFVNLFSSIDLKYYFADKRDLLGDAYPHLDDDEVFELLDGVPRIEYAKELGADKLLSGRVYRDYLGENRTIHWWWSVVQIECNITDVHTGEVEWSRRYDMRKQFSSQNRLQEEIAGLLVRDLKKEYFLPLARR